MNLLKKPFGLTLQALLWVMIFGCLLAHPFTNATSSPPGDKRDYVLIINSYNESSSWGWEIITDITARIEQIENLEVYVEHMNTLLMDQQSDLDNFRTNLSREYGKNPPRMLIYIGAPAFIMRDFAEKEWGKGIPSIICAEEDFIGPDKYYVSKRAIPHSERIPLRELSGEYNLTLLYAPIYLEQTIELMRRMIPEMNRLVFVRDGRYINQQYEDELRKLLDTDYPGMRFTSYKASNMSVDQLLDSLNVTDTYPIRVLYSVGLKDEVRSALEAGTSTDPDLVQYVANNAVDGKIHFYSNAYTGKKNSEGITIGDHRLLRSRPEQQLLLLHAGHSPVHGQSLHRARHQLPEGPDLFLQAGILLESGRADQADLRLQRHSHLHFR